MKWIKMCDQHPKKYQNCLIYGNGSITAGMFVPPRNWNSAHFICNGDEFETSSRQSLEIKVSEVTHWMSIEEVPLPEDRQP